MGFEDDAVIFSVVVVVFDDATPSAAPALTAREAFAEEAEAGRLRFWFWFLIFGWKVREEKKRKKKAGR